MYIADVVSQFRARAPRADARSAARLPSTVYALGTTSLLTDISAEMISGILPVYLLIALHLSPTQYGLADGLFRGGAAIVALLLGGMLAQSSGRAKWIAGAGYALSALTKLVLLATGAFAGIMTALTLDRLGKGVRTAPRDAILAASVPAEQLGLAFGVHRAMDAFGALAGPLLAALLLWLVPNGYGAVFATSFVVALVGLYVFHRFVRAPRSGSKPLQTVPSFSRMRAALTDVLPSSCRRLLGLAMLLTLFTVSEGLAYAHVQRSFDLEPYMQPLLPVATAAVFLLLSAPAGWIADRVGSAKVYVAAHGLLLPLYALLAISGDAGRPIWVVLVLLLLLGCFVAATDGVLMAAVSAAVPREHRVMSLAVFGACLAAMKMASSALFGWLWDRFDIPWAAAIFAGGLVITLASFWMVNPFKTLTLAIEPT